MVATMAGIAVAFLPWPRKAHLLAAIGQPVDAPTADRLAVECLQSVLRGLGAGLHKHDGPRVLTAHVMIGGSLTDHDQPIIGTSMELSVGDLALAAQRTEHRWAGVKCGIMDQMAALLGESYAGIFLDCRSLEADEIGRAHV